MKYDKYTVESTTYKNEFWDKMMKGREVFSSTFIKGKIGNGMYVLPYESNKKYNELINQESLFRRIGTNIKTKESDLKIWISDSNNIAEWKTNTYSEIKNVVNKFTKKPVDCHTLSIISRIDNSIIEDDKFDIDDFLIKNFAKSFGQAEENAFINGNGINMPTGILNETDGAEVGIKTNNLAFDEIINLYFSVKSEYRTKGSWIMNDEIAKTLYTLKDTDGNYLWNHNTNTIMGRPVYICNAMPSTGKVITFGDFSYYWVISRMPISCRSINELYAAHEQTGYLAQEYLDGKLIRTEAVKVLLLI